MAWTIVGATSTRFFAGAWSQIQYGMGRCICGSRAAIQRRDFSPTSEDAQRTTVQAYRCRPDQFDALGRAETDYNLGQRLGTEIAL